MDFVFCTQYSVFINILRGALVMKTHDSRNKPKHTPILHTILGPHYYVITMYPRNSMFSLFIYIDVSHFCFSPLSCTFYSPPPFGMR